MSDIDKFEITRLNNDVTRLGHENHLLRVALQLIKQRTGFYECVDDIREIAKAALEGK